MIDTLKPDQFCGILVKKEDILPLLVWVENVHDTPTLLRYLSFTNRMEHGIKLDYYVTRFIKCM